MKLKTVVKNIIRQREKKKKTELLKYRRYPLLTIMVVDKNSVLSLSLPYSDVALSEKCLFSWCHVPHRKECHLFADFCGIRSTELLSMFNCYASPSEKELKSTRKSVNQQNMLLVSLSSNFSFQQFIYRDSPLWSYTLISKTKKIVIQWRIETDADVEVLLFPKSIH